MSRPLALWLAAALLALAAGCSSPVLNRGSPAQARLTEAEARAAALARSGDYAGAARFYSEALRIATSLENADAIAANALRILGRSRIAAGEPSAAFEPLRSALDIDRELGDPRKILADLAELARAADAAGDADGARRYQERSVAVSRAMHEAKSGAEMEVLLRR